MKSVDAENNVKKVKHGTLPLILFMVGVVLLLIVVKFALNYFHH